MNTYPITQQDRIDNVIDHHVSDAAEYYRARPYMGGVENISTVAAARLEDLLKQGRDEISGLFSKQDVTYLVELFRGSLQAPCDMCCMIEGEPERTSYPPVAPKVQALTDLQRYALMDLVERCWYSVPSGEGSKLELFDQLGVEFRTPPRNSHGRFC